MYEILKAALLIKMLFSHVLVYLNCIGYWERNKEKKYVEMIRNEKIGDKEREKKKKNKLGEKNLLNNCFLPHSLVLQI